MRKWLQILQFKPPDWLKLPSPWRSLKGGALGKKTDLLYMIIESMFPQTFMNEALRSQVCLKWRISKLQFLTFHSNPNIRVFSEVKTVNVPCHNKYSYRVLQKMLHKIILWLYIVQQPIQIFHYSDQNPDISLKKQPSAGISWNGRNISSVFLSASVFWMFVGHIQRGIS